MSIHQVAEGLLETHVTWQDVEEEMQKSLGTEARFGGGKKVKNIGDKKGFMSRIALVEPDWIGVREGENLPKRFVVKMSSLLAFLEMSQLLKENGEENEYDDEKLKGMDQMAKTMHNREVSAYRILMKEKNKKVPIIRIYALRSFDASNPLKGFIISEYVADIFQIRMHECVPLQTLIPMVRAAATFSAIGEKLSGKESEFARGADFLDMTFGQYMDEKTILKFEKVLKESFPEEYSEKVERMFKINRMYYTNSNTVKRFKGICEFFGYRPILTHSDLYSSNFLCIKTDDTVALRAVIDFQTASFASPAHDIGRMLLSCLSSKNRRENTDFLLEEYYRAFVEELDEIPAPFTLEQLRDSYQVYFPLTAFLILPGIAPMIKYLVSEDQRGSLKEAAMEKMIGLMEDFLTVHDDSVKKFPKFFED